MTRTWVWSRYALAGAFLMLCLPGDAISQSAAPATNSTFKVGRTPDGAPDLQGVYSANTNGSVYSYDIEAPTAKRAYPFPPFTDRDFVAIFRPIIVDPPDRKIPYQPWARAERERLYEEAFEPKTLADTDPQASCILSAPPRTSYQAGYRIVQTPGYVIFLNGHVHQYRVVPLDGRPHVSDKIRQFAGDSRGRWEGDTLVVDITNFNGRTWLDVGGDFRTDATKVVERWTRTGPDDMIYEATIEDPKIYTRPFTLRIPTRRNPRAEDDDPVESACHEGNRAFKRLKPSAVQDGRIGK